ncbi:COMM domain-containing protein 4 [Halotydeus destructor]|nr:COMM domain-containing protein 4 [Halotydeus destructor]
MRFRFCGDLDCPDWVLVQIQSLSKLTSIKLKLLVLEIVKSILTNELKYEKISEITSAARFDDGDVRAVSSAIEFIINTAAKYDVTGDTLSDELQQLGLPKEHASNISKVYSEKRNSLRQCLRENILRESKLEDVSWEVNHEIVADNLKITSAVADLHFSTTTGVHSMVITRDKLSTMIAELKQARQMMNPK